MCVCVPWYEYVHVFIIIIAHHGMSHHSGVDDNGTTKKSTFGPKNDTFGFFCYISVFIYLFIFHCARTHFFSLCVLALLTNDQGIMQVTWDHLRLIWGVTMCYYLINKKNVHAQTHKVNFVYLLWEKEKKLKQWKCTHFTFSFWLSHNFNWIHFLFKSWMSMALREEQEVDDFSTKLKNCRRYTNL